MKSIKSKISVDIDHTVINNVRENVRIGNSWDNVVVNIQIDVLNKVCVNVIVNIQNNVRENVRVNVGDIVAYNVMATILYKTYTNEQLEAAFSNLEFLKINS